MENQAKLLEKLHLTPSKIKETLKNQALTQNLCEILSEIHDEIPQATAVLIYHLASKFPSQIKDKVPLLVRKILENKLDTTQRVEKAIEYCTDHLGDCSEEQLDEYCGVGIVVTLEQIEKEVGIAMDLEKPELERLRYKFNIGKIMGRIRTTLPWADGKMVRREVELQLVTLLGPKTEEDLGVATKTKVKPVKEKKVELKEETEESIIEVMKKVIFHKPGENYKTDGYVITEKTKELLEEHLKITGGKVRTRFPPEPNGILHIGHAKAININFGYAKAHNGLCYLRYDDTNPEKEEEQFFLGIRDMVEWLGYKPDKITHSSDYFDQLYEWAVQLIRDGHAYVCHQTADELKGFNPEPSPWRNRPVQESLQLFEDMKNGKLAEHSATLRLKMVLEEGKQDPVAYRIKYHPHHRTGTTWCIYPTYDYTHCLCDSLENITHSLCTKEFQSRRSSYYHLLNLLGLYCPVQFEYGRLNVNYTVVSKRKIAKLIQEGNVKNWDDPRLFTLSALRRKGYPSDAINKFCAQLGVTGSNSSVNPDMLESFVRSELNISARRTMVVLNPLKITIDGIKERMLDVPWYPNNPSSKLKPVKLCPVVYIERDDFNSCPPNDYRRLTMNQPVGLRYTGLVIQVVEVIRSDDGTVTELKCTVVNCKPKSFIHWVSEPVPLTVNLYEPLFMHKNPEDVQEVPGGFLSDVNLNSLSVVNGYGDQSLFHDPLKIFDKFQFERLGYFCLDPDSGIEERRLVFNRTVSLKEDGGK